MCLLGEQCPYDHGIDPVVITGPIPPPYAPPPFPMNIPPPPPPSLPNSSNGLMLPSVIPPPHPPMTVTTTSGTVQLSDITVYMYSVDNRAPISLCLIFHQLVYLSCTFFFNFSLQQTVDGYNPEEPSLNATSKVLPPPPPPIHPSMLTMRPSFPPMPGRHVPYMYMYSMQVG